MDTVACSGITVVALRKRAAFLGGGENRQEVKKNNNTQIRQRNRNVGV